MRRGRESNLNQIWQSIRGASLSESFRCSIPVDVAGDENEEPPATKRATYIVVRMRILEHLGIFYRHTSFTAVAAYLCNLGCHGAGGMLAC